MNPWLAALILLASACGPAKAHHFVKLVVLAGLGLAGLWMVHTLAQDYSAIQQQGGATGGALGGTASRLAGHFMQLLTAGSAGASGGSDAAAQGEGGGQEKYVFKRSTDKSGNNVTINWGLVMSRDPASCARSFVCQLAANNEEDLSKEELLMLEITRTSALEDTWASKQLQEALKNGEKLTSESQCMKIYKFCPYSRQMMMMLLRIFGS